MFTDKMQLVILIIYILTTLTTGFSVSSIRSVLEKSAPVGIHLRIQPPQVQFRAASSVAFKPIHNLRAGFLNQGGVDRILACPLQTFNCGLLVILGLVVSCRIGSVKKSAECTTTVSKPSVVQGLQVKFLVVFWLLRMADWLQGPYFFEVFNAKLFDGKPANSDVVEKIFLLGFATNGFIGPFLGQWVDAYGRKAGTLLYTFLYAFSALSTRSSHLGITLLGRIAGGLGTALLFSAPEAWLVGEHKRAGMGSKWLGQTFGWAYAGDAVVAIVAGQLATLAARRAGPTGPFLLSVAFLVVGALVAMWKWEENTAQSVIQSAYVVQEKSLVTNTTGENGREVKSQSGIKAAFSAIIADKKILLLGSVQALFEGAMYLFVLQWPPLIAAAIHGSHFGPEATVPYGNVFSCFMASCLLGSTLYGKLQQAKVSTEKSVVVMLATATLALAVAAHLGSSHLIGLSIAFFAFEACVGIYFPSIGSLRSKYLPDRHRAVMMNLFGIPLNLMVVSIVLGMKHWGPTGALGIASAALGVATVCMALLNGEIHKKPEILLF